MRQSAASYVAGFVARARPVTTESARVCLDLLSKWLNAYLDYFETAAGGSDAPEDHSLFYNVCQAVFYIVCFRHVQLFASYDGVDGPAAMARLGLDRVVNSRLNPLRVCLPSVVNEFARVMHEQQIVYCYAAMQRNARPQRSGNASPVRSGSSGAEAAMAYINREAVDFESFFAFEPLTLARTSPIVEPFYQQWEEREQRAVVATPSASMTSMAGSNGNMAASMAIRGKQQQQQQMEDEDELANFIISPESVGMDFMFEIRAGGKGRGNGGRANTRRR